MRGTDISKKLLQLRALPERQIPQGLSEYLLVLSPPAGLWEEVMRIKKYFGGKYQAPAALKTKPHITLVKFVSPRSLSDAMILHLGRIAARLHPFRVQAENFGSFPTHTIYLRVGSGEPFRQAVTAVKEARRFMRVKEFEPHFIQEPHMTICRKLLPWQYEQAWLEFAHLDFSGCFVAEELLLLRRPFDGSLHRYETAARLPLKGITPPAPEQIALFNP